MNVHGLKRYDIKMQIDDEGNELYKIPVEDEDGLWYESSISTNDLDAELNRLKAGHEHFFAWVDNDGRLHIYIQMIPTNELLKEQEIIVRESMNKMWDASSFEEKKDIFYLAIKFPFPLQLQLLLHHLFHYYKCINKG